eukprot:TRINITY_DN56520_c0_g1_i1.p1 TRINITY_DN56520_c0_g1~~TRINITY_DN56520_c0_g1_i1.p1  ORF type:complete len:169 (-),score=25.14 TRINITY_DN56520_c0_g1_i1:32-499(-)
MLGSSLGSMFGSFRKDIDEVQQAGATVQHLFPLVPGDRGKKTETRSHRRRAATVQGLRKEIDRVRSFIQPRKAVQPSYDSIDDAFTCPLDLDDVSFDLRNLSLDSDDDDVVVKKPVLLQHARPVAPSTPKPVSTFRGRRLQRHGRSSVEADSTTR